jgi:hypothetical protein
MNRYHALVAPRPACFTPAMRILLLLLATALLQRGAHAAGWELHEDAKTGAQVAACTVTGTGPRGPAKATLVLHHRRGQPLKVVKKANVTELPIIIELCVDGYESVKGFDFLAFEGPDAPAADKRLTAVTIEAGKERFAKRFNQGGWINQLAWLLESGAKTDSAKANDFTFGIGDASRDVKDFITITRLLQQSPTKIAVSVTDAKDPKSALRFAFSADQAAEVIGKLMR